MNFGHFDHVAKHFLDIYTYKHCADIKYRKQFNDKLAVVASYQRLICVEIDRNSKKKPIPILTGNPICDCLSENLPSLHLPVFREIPF